MARKAKHDQRADGGVKFVCEMCLVGVCERCIDVGRITVFGLDTPLLCQCTKQGHSGEANEKQITDPESGTVWGPGLRVTTDGEVIRGGYDSDADH
jgi:hypothetical protein